MCAWWWVSSEQQEAGTPAVGEDLSTLADSALDLTNLASLWSTRDLFSSHGSGPEATFSLTPLCGSQYMMSLLQSISSFQTCHSFHQSTINKPSEISPVLCLPPGLPCQSSPGQAWARWAQGDGHGPQTVSGDMWFLGQTTLTQTALSQGLNGESNTTYSVI